MADNFRVLDLSAGDLEANLNAINESWVIMHWDFYDRTVVAPGPSPLHPAKRRPGSNLPEVERRVTVVMVKVSPQAVPLPPGFDPRILRRN